MTATIHNAYFDQESQLLILDVFFHTSEESFVHLVAPQFAFITDRTWPSELNDIQLGDEHLTIDLSRRFNAIPRGATTEGPTDLGMTQAVLIHNLHHEPYSGLISIKYVFRFPIYNQNRRFGPVSVHEAPCGKQKVNLIFGYGLESPLAFERMFPDRNDQLALDKALNQQWQRLLHTEAVEVDFGPGPKSGEAKGKAMPAQ